MISILIVLIETQLIHDECEYQHAAGETNGKTEKIDEGNKSVLHQIPESNFQITPDHSKVFMVLFSHKTCHEYNLMNVNWFHY